MKVQNILQKMAENFQKKMEQDFTFIVQFNIKDVNEFWYVIITNRKVTLHEGQYSEPHVFLDTTKETLHRIYQGAMTGFTAAGKARISDGAPLDWKLSEHVRFTPQLQAALYSFVQHFFNLTEPEKVVLAEEKARLVHGGHCIPLYYYPGFRSGWYVVKKGERMNEPGDTNPFPQAIIILEGAGKAKIGDTTVSIGAGESYYIPPGSDHVVWTEEDTPLTLIWLAWGEGA